MNELKFLVVKFRKIHYSIWFQSKLYDNFLSNPSIKLEPYPAFGVNHSRVIATKNISSKHIFEGLDGILFPTGALSHIFDNHFSLMKFRGMEHLLLGPISFINHSCQPNAIYRRFERFAESIVSVQTMRKIKAGEEITVSYGKHYFEGETCLCSKCSRARELPHRPENQVPISLQHEVIYLFIYLFI